MPKEQADQMTMVVELRGLPHDWHDAVGARELEQRVDFLIVEPGDEIAKGTLFGEFLAEPIAPLAFVRRESGRVQPIGGERVDGDISRKRRTPDAVVNTAPRRGFYEPGGVT